MGEKYESETVPGLLKIGNEIDRATVATILFKNGYAVEKVVKKNGKTNEYFVGYSLPQKKTEVPG